jgi:hypothetical protein
MELTISYAAHYVIRRFYPEFPFYTELLRAHHRAVSTDEIREDAKQVGERAAANVLRNRISDDTSSFVDYFITNATGRFQPIPSYPTVTVAQNNWAEATPFVLPSPGHFLVGPPLPLNSLQYAIDYNETRDYGNVTSQLRSEDQTQAAYFHDTFWYQGAITGTETTLGIWSRISRQLANAFNLHPFDTIVLLYLLHVSCNDVVLANTYNKAVYDAWRPVTAIRSTVNWNPFRGAADPTWNLLLDYPGNSEYPGGHATGNGCLDVLWPSFFGTRQLNMSATPNIPGLRTRYWPNMDAFMREASDSRIWGGRHFRFSNDAGEQLGRLICSYTFDRICGRNDRCKRR